MLNSFDNCYIISFNDIPQMYEKYECVHGWFERTEREWTKMKSTQTHTVRLYCYRFVVVILLLPLSHWIPRFATLFPLSPNNRRKCPYVHILFGFISIIHISFHLFSRLFSLSLSVSLFLQLLMQFIRNGYVDCHAPFTVSTTIGIISIENSYSTNKYEAKQLYSVSESQFHQP